MRFIFMSLIFVTMAAFVIQQTNENMPAHSTRTDGPYVIYRNSHVVASYILDQHEQKIVQSDSIPESGKTGLVLTVATEEQGQFFRVALKKQLQNEKSEYPMPEKMFVLSDLEGNFSAFRKLLLTAGIIDSAFNWAFGNGHLVLTGDFVDRGAQVTELLWCIYLLEEKAKAAGGYVHYILGNHEIMNLSGDLRYVHAKYLESASLLQTGFTSLFGEASELGRWLRTKNVMEKIGNILFVHGGISAPVNHMELSASKLNKLVRPYYADSLYNYDNPRLDTLYSDLGPFWYRGYYKSLTPLEENTIESTLKLYHVKKIITGHTVIADSISMLYQGKVFNTDVHHAGGHSEGLLLEKGNWYRVTPAGEKFFLSVH